MDAGLFQICILRDLLIDASRDHALLDFDYDGFDFVWAPLTSEEFAKLSPMGRLLDRIYRSGYELR